MRFIELHTGKASTTLLNLDTVIQIYPASDNRAMLYLVGGGSVLVDEAYDEVSRLVDAAR
jgi:hypothetical protein